MKKPHWKLLLILTLGLLLTPTMVFAKPRPRTISATEMVPIGFTAAGLIGVAGYLVVRRRKLANRQS